MERNQQHHHDGGFMNGFLLGAIIGAAVIFFLFTEKGKKLLKTITEEGVEGFSELKDLISEEMDEDGDYEATYDDLFEDDASVKNDDTDHPIKQTAGVASRKGHHSPEPMFESDELIQEMHHSPSKVKRFFRGIKRG